MAAMAAPNTRNDLTCQICMDIVTDFDEWLTSDKTEQEIVDFVKEVRFISFSPKTDFIQVVLGLQICCRYELIFSGNIRWDLSFDIEG